jgi:hypothetical protein
MDWQISTDFFLYAAALHEAALFAGSLKTYVKV